MNISKAGRLFDQQKKFKTAALRMDDSFSFYLFFKESGSISVHRFIGCLDFADDFIMWDKTLSSKKVHFYMLFIDIDGIIKWFSRWQLENTGFL